MYTSRGRRQALPFISFVLLQTDSDEPLKTFAGAVLDKLDIPQRPLTLAQILYSLRRQQATEPETSGACKAWRKYRSYLQACDAAYDRGQPVIDVDPCRR